MTLKHVRKAHPDITDAASHVRKTITQTTTQTTRETLDDGRVATCTTQTMQISRYLSTSVSYIETQTASVRAISQEHPMVTVSTFTQQSPRVSASAGTEERTPEVLVDVDHIHRVLDDPGDQDFWKELLDE
ncbi:hypothetical protein [Candidatus Sororendozoicomonas aggregata]|uniref:hypothetical protein n=1 Tax=Candidatus Sororendozoicomonas aggregata TaxID=3073239 RepID=UPI002ED3D832